MRTKKNNAYFWKLELNNKDYGTEWKGERNPAINAGNGCQWSYATADEER